MSKFNKSFMLGAATAAHQVEGNNIHSDYWTQENIEHSNFVEPSLDAVDHYNRYKEDITILKDAGLNSYRFSIEWARIQPTPDSWIDKEVNHYRDVLKFCNSNNITPIVTLHHFSSPKWLISEGGWESENTIERFSYYATRIVTELSEELHYICTINEANMRLQLAALIKNMKLRRQVQNDSKAKESDVQVGVNMSMENMMLTMQETAEAFGISDPTKVFPFISEGSKHGDEIVLRSHEKARDSIKKLFPQMQVGLTLSLHDLQSEDNGEEVVNKEWDDEFTHYLKYIRNDDFLGVQGYSRKTYNQDGPVIPIDQKPTTQMGYEDYPVAIGNVVKKVAKDFKGPIIVTENGIATDDDDRRCQFIETATESILDCIRSGIDVRGYMYWSLLDNFEWQKGYSMTFGLIEVDRKTQKRYPKKSIYFLGSI